MSESRLTEQEQLVLSLLSQAWNEIVKLPVLLSQENGEIARSMNDIQARIMSRPERSPEVIKKKLIEVFTPHICNPIIRGLEIETIEQLVTFSEKDLRRCNGMGKNRVKFITDYLAKHNLKMK